MYKTSSYSEWNTIALAVLILTLYISDWYLLKMEDGKAVTTVVIGGIIIAALYIIGNHMG